MGPNDRVLGVAVIGVGEVAMTTHLPNLLLHSHMFRTVALVDVSPGALAHASSKFNVPRTYTDTDAMLAEASDVDVVMIMSADQYHVSQTVASLQAGKDVFVEKPMALSESGADEIVAAAKKAGKVVFVGFMRRYAEAFLRVKDIVHKAPKGGIAYVRVRDIIGKNPYFVDQGGAFPLKFTGVVQPSQVLTTDTPAEAVEDRKRRADAMLAEVMGDARADERNVQTWGLLTSLSSHDISAMRELIGMPRRVLSAARSPDCNWIWAMLEYDGFVAYYEVGIDDVRVFDAHIEVYLRDKRVKVTYDTPYIKGLPITATVLSSKPNGDHTEEIIRPTYEDAFTLEYRHLYDAIVHGKPVKTTPEDAKQDLAIFKMIMDAILRTEGRK